MAKQILKVTDFTGGVNSYSDPRDIQDNQFAQNWNAALDKTGIVRYSGGGLKSIKAPQSNTKQINGFGLFRFSTDYSINSLDSDFNVGIETGTIDDYTSQTEFVLENTDTVSSADDYYNGMTILIYSGTGAGKSRSITDYVGSSRTITCDDFGTTLHDKNDGTPSLYKIIPWGVDGNFGNQADLDWITDGSTSGFPTAVESPNDEESGDFYLLSKTATISDESHASLGYIEYKKSLTLKAGITYTLSFDARAQRKWLNYVSDGESDGSVIKSDQVPWVYLTSANANLGLFSDGERAKFISITGGPTYSGLQANYVDNGDFQDGTGTGWSESDSGSVLTFAEDASSKAYGGHDGTAVLTSTADFTFNNEPSAYLHTDNMSLSENTPHHLNFLYASTDGIAYSVYDTTNSAVIIPWTVLPATDSSSTYQYANEEVDNTSGYGKKQAQYISFMTNNNATADAVVTNVQVRFAPIKASSTARLAGVVLRKGVCDLNTMSYNGSGASPFLDNQITEWSNYTIKFKLTEEEYGTEQSDWVFRIFGGLATHRASATNSEDTQAVYIGNIKLISEEVDTITLLNDNASDGSYITMYSDSKSNWDTNFIKWPGLSSMPTYDYINGALKISDGNFNNENENLLVYRYDRRFLNKYFNSGWVVSNKPLCDSPNVAITATTEDGIFGTKFNCIDYINTLYAGLEYKNANRQDPDKYLHEESGSTVVQRGIAADNSFWNDGHWTNWDMDEIDKGVLIRYAYHNENGGMLDDDDQQRPDSMLGGQKGYKESQSLELVNLEERTDSEGDGDKYTPNAQRHCVGRGIRGHANYSQNGIKYGGHNPISFFICGQDTSNPDADMHTIVGADKKISSLVFEFTHEFQSARKVGSNENEVAGGTVPYFKIDVYKIPSNIKPDNTQADIPYNNKTSGQTILMKQLAADSLDTYFTSLDDTEHLRTEYVGKGDHDAGRSFKDSDLQELEIINIQNPMNELDGMLKIGTRVQGQITFTGADNLTSNDSLYITIEEISTDKFTWAFSRGLEDVDNTAGDTHGLPEMDYTYKKTAARYTKIIMQKLELEFYGTTYDEDTSNVQEISDDIAQVNFNFGAPDGVDGTGWGEGIFRIASSSVNIFDEESGLNENLNENIGASTSGTGTISLGHAPTLTVHLANSILRDRYKKKTKFYMKKTESDIWYLQFFIDHETGLLHSTTSSKKISGTINSNKDSTMWSLEREGIANFNEVDSYESQTGISQESALAANNALLNCRYKTSVVANNRLYVGNIEQNGNIYGDRMIKSPINKYNILPSTNFIDVAINDGDEITALAYYKDKLLQYKKRKVFVINTSADYEYLENTFDNIGVQRQCQVVTTPMGIAWANSSGCFLYDGQQIMNLIDNKLGTEAFQSGINNNFWKIENDDIPSIGYIKSTKKLIINQDVVSHTVTDYARMWQFDFISQGWTFLFRKEKADTTSGTFASSNFINDENGDMLYYSKASKAIYKWNDSPISNTSNLDFFTLITKDYDFGNPSVRKKIYKVYVTFKSIDDSNGSGSKTAAHSNIKAYYATNGDFSDDNWTEFSTNSKNYDTTNGLSDGASSVEWIQAELKPPSSINNVNSIALKFQGSGNIPNRFEINDFSIVYRIKRVK
jgi:hypothetical protein